MGWMLNDVGTAAKSKATVKTPELDICLDGENWITVNKHSVDKCYNDAMLRLIIVIDEIAELTMPGKLKTAEGKEEDALKEEIMSHIQSITQLGRNSGVHCILCTQRNDAAVVPGIVQNNPLALDTLVEVKD